MATFRDILKIEFNKSFDDVDDFNDFLEASKLGKLT